MSVDRHEQAVESSATEVVPSSFMVYPATLQADDFRVLSHREWFERNGDPRDPRSILLAQKEAEGFKKVAQCLAPAGSRDSRGDPFVELTVQETQDADSAIAMHEVLVARHGVENVVALRPAPGDLMGPERAPIDEIIFMTREDSAPGPQQEGITTEFLAQVLNDVHLAVPSGAYL